MKGRPRGKEKVLSSSAAVAQEGEEIEIERLLPPFNNDDEAR